MKKYPSPKTIEGRCAVPYLRQSKTDEQELLSGASLSSDAQLARCMAYCALHGFTLDEATGKACTDLDTSAKAQVRGRRVKDRWKKRPGLARLYDLAATGAYAHIICYDLSRLARDVSELFEIRDAFAHHGVTIHLVSEGIRTDTDLGELILGILGSVYQMESRNQSRRFRDAWQQMAEGGRPHGKPPLWIVTDTSKPMSDMSRYSFHPERAETIRRMVAIRCLGYPYHKVADTLNNEGHASMQGGKWKTWNVFDLLQADRRVGMIGNQIFKGSSGKRIVLKAVYPALLSDEEFRQLETVQVTIAGSTVQGGGKAETIRQDTSSLASGLLHCGICGDKMKAVSSATIYRQYMCVNAYTSGIPHPNQRPTPSERVGSYSIGRDKVDNSLLDALGEISRRYPAESLPVLKPKQVKVHHRSVEALNEEVDYLYEQRRDKKIAQRDYDRRYAKLLKERETIERQEEEEEGEASMHEAMRQVSAITSEMEPAQVRLIVRLLASSIVFPVAIPGLPQTRSGGERQGLRLTFKRQLPDGVKAIVVGVYRTMYKGEKYAAWEM